MSDDSKNSDELILDAKTPSPIRARAIKLKIEKREIQNQKLKNEWKMCGSGTNRHLLKYIVQMSISLLVLVFSLTRLSYENEEDKEIYISLVSFILGVIFPHPQIKDE